MTGSIQLKHPDLMEFREKSEKMNFYNRHHESDKERVMRAQKEAKQRILEKDYNEKEPNKKHYLKPRVSLDDISARLRY